MAHSTDNAVKILILVIIDTVDNKELNDLHAVANHFFNDEVFITIGITVSASDKGGLLLFPAGELTTLRWPWQRLRIL